MFRKTMICAVFSLFLAELPVSAQTNTVVTLGGNYWYAQRKLSGDYYLGGDIESKAGNMFGPYVNLRIGNVMIGTSAFWGKFTESNKVGGMYQDIDAKRTDINGSLGYSLINRTGFNVSVFGAVKSLAMKRSYSYVYTDKNFMDWDIDAKYDETGTLFGGGVSGVVRFTGSPVFIFGSASYLQGNRKFKKTESTDGEEIEGWGFDDKATTGLSALSGGIGFQAGSNVSILVGYRADIFNFKLDREDIENYDGIENLNGMMATLAYTLR
jgi:hypothetical protein